MKMRRLRLSQEGDKAMERERISLWDLLLVLVYGEERSAAGGTEKSIDGASITGIDGEQVQARLWQLHGIVIELTGNLITGCHRTGETGRNENESE